MLQIRFINYFLFFIFINICFIVVLTGKIKDKKILSILGCLISLIIITAICFFPFPYQEELINDRILNNLSLSNNYIPFHTIFIAIIDSIKYHVFTEIIYSIMGNIILFIPLGFSLFFFIEVKKKRLILFICLFFVSFTIESLQWIMNFFLEFNYRAVDIDDIILNMCGGIIGYAIAYYLSKTYHKSKKINSR